MNIKMINITLVRKYWFSPFLLGPHFIFNNVQCFQIMTAFVLFWDGICYSPGRPQIYYATKDDFEFWVYLPKCWGAGMHDLFHLNGVGDPKEGFMHVRHSSNWGSSSVQFLLFEVLYIDELRGGMLDPLLHEAGVPCCFLSVCAFLRSSTFVLGNVMASLLLASWWDHKRLQGHIECPLESSRETSLSCYSQWFLIRKVSRVVTFYAALKLMEGIGPSRHGCGAEMGSQLTDFDLM